MTPTLACLVLVPALAAPPRPVAATATATASLVAASAVQADEELLLDLNLDERAEEEGMEVDVEVDPHAGIHKAPKPGKAPTGLRGLKASRPASYQVNGLKKGVFSVTLPAGDDCLLAARGATLAVRGFKLTVDEGEHALLAPADFTLDDKGVRGFQIGATLRLAAHQPRTTYHGRFNVTVAWD